MDELTRAIQTTNNSASGPDGIHNALLKLVSPDELDTLHNLYTNVETRILS